MRERLAEFGGDVQVSTGAQGGFCLKVSLPLGEEPALAHALARGGGVVWPVES
jgi:hypothetical protein